MRKLKLYIAASLDGKIATKDHSLDWLPDPTAEDYGYRQFYDSLDTVIMGYKTYETSIGFGEWHYKDKKSYVFSRNGDKDIIAEASLVTDNPADFVKRLKAEQGKDIWIVGGGEIVRLLHDAGLIDEYIIAIVPILLGEGIELFPHISTRTALTLADQRVYKNGVILTYYEPEKG